ncbi:MAG: EamA family transporter [Agathobacter rectalis]
MVSKTDSNVATAIRTIVVLIFSWIMVFVVKAQGQITAVSAKTWIFLMLSGVATGASWLCYFKALQLGDVNRVVPIDKSSTILTIILAFIFFKEEINVLRLVCVVLIAIGTYMMITKKEISQEEQNKARGSHGWLFYAVLSVVLPASPQYGKGRHRGINSNLGTAIRTIVVLIMAWIVVFATGKQHTIKHIEKKSLALSAFRDLQQQLMALLLQGTAGRTCECRSAYR